MPLDPLRWDKAIEENFQTYSTWQKELVKEVEDIQKIYLDDGRSEEEFEEDFKLSKRLYRDMRLQEIRGKKHVSVGLIGDQNEEQSLCDDKYRIVWQNFFRDQDLIEEINKDVKRTRTELEFFKKPLQPQLLKGRS